MRDFGKCLTISNFIIPEQLASILDECDKICVDMSAGVETIPMSQWQKRTSASDTNWGNWRDHCSQHFLTPVSFLRKLCVWHVVMKQLWLGALNAFLNICALPVMTQYTVKNHYMIDRNG
jgi:hypothetical protein